MSYALRSRPAVHRREYARQGGGVVCRAARSDAGTGASGLEDGQPLVGVNHVVHVAGVAARGGPLAEVGDPILEVGYLEGVAGVPEGLAGYLLVGDGADAVGRQFVGVCRVHRRREGGDGGWAVDGFWFHGRGLVRGD